MRLFADFMFAAIFLVASVAAVRGDAPPASPTAEAMTGTAQNSIAGLWSSDAVAMATDGSPTMFFNENKQQPISLTIGEKQFTMRIGDKVVAEMTYELDTKQMPWTIDLKSDAGNLLGVCIRTGPMLRLVLNDEATGRPTNFNQASGGMMLTLRQFPPRSLFTINADGSNLTRVLTMPDYTFIGSPSCSHDGQRIAVDAWHALYGEQAEKNEVLILSVDGKDVKSLGSGCMPSWSTDDKQLVFGVRGKGIWIMNADGSDRRQVAADGWGAEWSPVGNEVAMSVTEGDRANLYLLDVASGQRRPLLKKAYQKVLIGMSWSPDGKWICFKGLTPDGKAELAAVSTEGEEKGFKVLLPGELPGVEEFDNTVAWGGNGNQIVVSAAKRNGGPQRPYVLDFTGAENAKPLAGYPAQYGLANTTWTSDGKTIVMTAAPPPK